VVAKHDGEPDAVAVISPLYAVSAEQLTTRAIGFDKIKPNDIVYINAGGPEASR
jgi:hypothetical protein